MHHHGPWCFTRSREDVGTCLMTSTTSLQHLESACKKHRQSPVAADAPAFICRALPRGARSTWCPAASSMSTVLQRVICVCRKLAKATYCLAGSQLPPQKRNDVNGHIMHQACGELCVRRDKRASRVRSAMLAVCGASIHRHLATKSQIFARARSAQHAHSRVGPGAPIGGAAINEHDLCWCRLQLAQRAQELRQGALFIEDGHYDADGPTVAGRRLAAGLPRGECSRISPCSRYYRYSLQNLAQFRLVRAAPRARRLTWVFVLQKGRAV